MLLEYGINLLLDISSANNRPIDFSCAIFLKMMKKITYIIHISNIEILWRQERIPLYRIILKSIYTLYSGGYVPAGREVKFTGASVNELS